MFRLAKPFFIRAITPLHAGSGQDLGIVDMPIQRERHTGFPKIEASGLKGAIREIFREKAGKDEKKKRKINIAFGPEENGQNAHSGSLGFTDARLLLFPVKSVKGVFAYITCPQVLKKFNEDLKICNIEKHIEMETIHQGKCIVSNENILSLNESKVILEEYTFEVERSDDTIGDTLSGLTGIEDLKPRLVILNDDDFKDFIMLSTEVITRTKIDTTTGVVVDGALFTEEYLPPETVMYSLVLASKIFSDEKNDFDTEEKDQTEEEAIMQYFKEEIPAVMQIGGNSTIGKGIVKIKLLEV